MVAEAHFPAPGGMVDAALADRLDVYVGTPEQAAGSPAYALARKYVEICRNGRYEELADLFSDDAVIFPPVRQRPARGRAEIEAFYRDVVAKFAPRVIGVSIVGEGSECFMELAQEIELEGERRYRLSSIDHFTLGPDGRFSRMIVYVRPA
jgi:hypothetical protein